MGQKLTQAKQAVMPEVETFLLKYCPYFQFVKLLNDGIFLKTALVVNDYDGEPLVCKIYFKRELNDYESKLYSKHLESMREISELYTISKSPNVCPIINVDNLQKAGMIIRQYYSYNLKERIACMPYLTTIEKKWISFQIIYGLIQIHNKGLCHGDIKLENVLISSSGSAFLGDFAPYKPAYIQLDDVGTFIYYFGSNSAIKSCYLSPERLVEKKELSDLSNSIFKVTTAMDVFSLGAVIAELFLEDMLFDHSKLLDYKRGDFSLEGTLKKIGDAKLEDILSKMMKPNPDERISLSECFTFFAEEICPISFSRMLIHFNTLFVSFDYWKPDKKIGIIYKHWRQIWKTLFGPDSEVPELYQNLNHIILNKLILDNPFSKCYIENYPLIFDLKEDNNLLTEERGKTIALPTFSEKCNSECVLIMINYILTAILNMKYPTSKIVAMEILRIFSGKVSDIIKIQLIIPYLVKLLKENNNLVRLTALHELMTILYMINDSQLILPSSDFNFFDAYIFPSVLELYYSGDPTLILAFANIIDKLTDLEQKFLQITIRSRFYNMRNQNNPGYNSMGSSQLLRQTISYKDTQSAIRDRGEEIIQAYDTDLYEFKSTLFKIIEDILSKNEELDIQQTLIRKLPQLMLFFGRRETNNFSKFIIAHFNKKEWVIQREILKYIPSLMVTLGETALNQFIVPCMESIINNNPNELKIYEMIHTMHLLLKMEYLETIRAIDLFMKILPYVMHPNLWIRNEVISFASTLINLLSQGEVYTYIRPELKVYLYMPFIIITSDLIKKATKERMSRVIYELETSGIAYNFNKLVEDEEALHYMQNILAYAKESNKYNEEYTQENNKGNNNNPVNGDFEGQLIRLRAALEGVNLSGVIKKEFNKFIKEYNKDDSKFLERTFLGKLISFSNIIHSLTLPNIKRRISITFSPNNDNFLCQEYFRIKYLFKALEIVIKEEILDELDTGDTATDFPLSQSVNTGMISQDIKTARTQTNSFSKSTMQGWRPQGKLLNTLYEHQTQSGSSSVERLLSLQIENMNKFLSFGSDGEIMLWDISLSDTDITCEKISGVFTTGNLPIEYSRGICNVDSNQFVVATRSELELFKIESAKSDFYISNRLSITNSSNNSFKSDSDVCAVISNCNAQESKMVIYCNQKGRLQIYDPRLQKSAIGYDINVQRGMISCMDFSKDERSLYIGTLGGYVLNYDFRLNSVTESFRYNENTPIIGLSSYLPSRGKEYDLYSMNLNTNYNNYLTIWTGAADHEIGLWNLNTLNCDVLFKVNSLTGKEIRSLTAEIPSLIKETTKEDLYSGTHKNSQFSIENLYKSIARYLHTFNSNSTKRILINNIKSDFYSHSNKRLSKLSNLFEIPSNVQIVVSPQISQGVGVNLNLNLNENSPYLISAGNDMTIRYWDISKEGINSTANKKSYLINAPNKIENCLFTTSVYDSTTVLQSNESQNVKLPKKDIPGFSEYQNYNGISFHLIVQNEFDENMEVLKYCTKISDAAHKNAITDLLAMTTTNPNLNLLISSSWDGTIKIWK